MTEAALPADTPYVDSVTRARALELAMWIFIGSEVLLFAGLFALYTSYRATYSHAFAQAVSHDDELLGSSNTFILLISSFFAALGLDGARRRKPSSSLSYLTVTGLLGIAFLVLKGAEYHDHLSHGIAPGAAYSFAGLRERGAELFFTLYYCMTGLHALHVIAGLVLFGVAGMRLARTRCSPRATGFLHLCTLYWHMVDTMWIFLWPMFYLMK